ncbi:hypothetical protein, variant 1 [Aphanomyces invadans]|nr:hypothetical protein, variant 1 [Aphanomyces invadans]ETV93192.1 hypothetical protein, variant 1 [Aphanomyces invadans]|eukprot:XP_008878213.1 hypothetical protein, variant 1 [Aphanomyces invadans]
MDIPLALKRMESLLDEFPDLVADLTSILKVVDAGESVVIGGIANKEMKARLAELFPLMGLVESGPNESYAKHKVAMRRPPLVDTFRIALQPRPKRAVSSPAPPAQISEAPKHAQRVLGPIGPSLPLRQPPAHIDDDDDDVVGPALPGMKGFREASAEVEERMRAQAEAEEALAWKRVRGEIPNETSGAPAVLEREEWMLSLPDNESIQAALGGLGDQSARKFRSRDKNERDASWFASPAEREQALREKAQWEMLGYVPGKPEAAEQFSRQAVPPPTEAPTTPALPRQERSLLEKHQDAIKKDAKSVAPAAWDRDRDMASRRQLSGDAASSLIQQATMMSSRFAAPKVTRTFL